MVVSVLQQHQQLAESADQLRILLETLHRPDDISRNPQIACALAGFHGRFCGCVRARTNGGLLVPVLEHRLTQTPAVNRLGLRTEHLIHRLRRLRRTGDALLPAHGSTRIHSDRRERLLRLLEEVRRIEEDENDLVQSVFRTQIGYPASC